MELRRRLTDCNKKRGREESKGVFREIPGEKEWRPCNDPSLHVLYFLWYSGHYSSSSLILQKERKRVTYDSHSRLPYFLRTWHYNDWNLFSVSAWIYQSLLQVFHILWLYFVREGIRGPRKMSLVRYTEACSVKTVMTTWLSTTISCLREESI